MARFWIAALVLVVGLSASSCGPEVTSDLPATATEAMEENQAAYTRSVDRYVNPDGGFSLVLPEGWEVVGPMPVSQDGMSYDLYLLGVNPSSSDGPGASRIIVADAAVLSIEQFVALQCSTCPQHSLESIPLGERLAVRTRITGGGVPFEVDWIFVEDQGKLLGFSIHDPETLESLESVIQTLVLD